VETRGKGAFDLDGASEPLQLQAQGTLVSVIRATSVCCGAQFKDCRCAGLSANLNEFGIAKMTTN
jgi:hypothetical protein